MTNKSATKGNQAPSFKSRKESSSPMNKKADARPYEKEIKRPAKPYSSDVNSSQCNKKSVLKT